MTRRGSSLVGVAVVLVALLSPSGAVASKADDDVGLVDSTTGRWYLHHEHPDGGDGVTSFLFGNPGDAPFVGDWDCDGTDTPGLYRRSDGYVYLRDSNSEGMADATFFFGDPGDVPVAGDFNGDGCDTVSLYRPSEGRAYIVNTLGEHGGGLGAADYSYYYGNPADTPFVGDFNGDGVETLGLHRESTGQVFLRNSHTEGAADIAFYYGIPGDKIIAGAWRQHDDALADTVGIYRGGDRSVYLRFSNTPGIADWTLLFGNPSMVPVAGGFGMLSGNDDWPDMQSGFTATPFQNSSGGCGVELTWNWDGPIWTNISIHPGGGHGTLLDSFAGLVDATGDLSSYTHTFAFEAGGGFLSAGIYAGGPTNNRFIDSTGFYRTPDCLELDQ